jgi:hypothetical protein
MYVAMNEGFMQDQGIDSTSNLARAGQVHVLAWIGKELGRAENTVFLAKNSWYEKNREAAQKLTNAIAKAQAWMKAASDEQIAGAIAPYFPSIPMEISATLVKRYRETGAPVCSQSPVIYRTGAWVTSSRPPKRSSRMPPSDCVAEAGTGAGVGDLRVSRKMQGLLVACRHALVRALCSKRAGGKRFVEGQNVAIHNCR